MENLTPPPAHQFSAEAEKQRQTFIKLIEATKPVQKLLQEYDISHTVIITANSTELLMRELYKIEKNI